MATIADLAGQTFVAYLSSITEDRTITFTREDGTLVNVRCGCIPGTICEFCTARFPRIYTPPGTPEREEALKNFEILKAAIVAAGG